MSFTPQLQDIALDRISTFADKFGENHILLAMHAAIPLGLTPEIVHLIRINFLPHSQWIAEADLLLSPLCREVGGDFFEMDLEIRDILIQEIKSDPELGPIRIKYIAEFLFAYTQRELQQIKSQDISDFCKAQEIAALSYLNPFEAESKIAQSWQDITKNTDQDIKRAESLRIIDLTKALTEPLYTREKILYYSAVRESALYEEYDRLNEYVDLLKPDGDSVNINNVILPIPEMRIPKIIIGIHGLGNKPSKTLLEEWWVKSIQEGLKIISSKVISFDFELVYWSDLIHPEPEDYNLTDRENPLFVSEPYTPADTWSEPKSDNRRKKIQKFMEEQLERILINADGTVNFASITDKIIQRYFSDLDIYYSGECIGDSNVLIRDAIRERLVKVLKDYQGYSIMLIAHSMGSVIAYDVLKNYDNDIAIDTFITIGSPLGLPIITGKIMKEQGGSSTLTVPNNIKKDWFNFSDLEDKVAINYDLADDYAPSLSGVEITDFEIYNNYEVNGIRNPHKVYGYLRTPNFAEIISNFVKERIPQNVNKKSKW